MGQKYAALLSNSNDSVLELYITLTYLEDVLASFEQLCCIFRNYVRRSDRQVIPKSILTRAKKMRVDGISIREAAKRYVFSH